MIRYGYHKAGTVDEVLALQGEFPGALFIAGGTDLMVKIRNGEVRPPALISLRSVRELSGISVIENNGGTRIGAMTTISELIEHPTLHGDYPVLVEAARRHSGPQIRNVATIGGNLCNCSPCADTATPLLVLDARVSIRGAGGSRDIPVDEFFKGPGETCLAAGEIMTDILLGPPQKKAKAVFMKKGRVRMDLAVASVAVHLEPDGKRCRKVRVAAGSVAPVPLRLRDVEELLEENALSNEILDRAQKTAAESVAPITDIRASEEYRRRIVGVYVKRAVEKLMGSK